MGSRADGRPGPDRADRRCPRGSGPMSRRFPGIGGQHDACRGPPPSRGGISLRRGPRIAPVSLIAAGGEVEAAQQARWLVVEVTAPSARERGRTRRAFTLRAWRWAGLRGFGCTTGTVRRPRFATVPAMFPACEISRRRHRIYYEAVNVQRNALRRQLAGERPTRSSAIGSGGGRCSMPRAHGGSIDTAAVAISP